MSARKHSRSKKEKISDLKSEINTDVHTVDMAVLVERLNTSLDNGLSSDDAEERLLNDGPNQLTPMKKRSEILHFISCCFGGFGILMWIGGILCLVSFVINLGQGNWNWDQTPKDNFTLGWVLIVVVLMTGTFSYVQDFRSSKIMERFSKMIPQQTLVWRDGQRKEVSVVSLVVGDVVEVKGGDKLPADIRIINSAGFKVDNSSLTGESEPQTRIAQCTSDNPMETKNLAFFSTNAVEGACKGLVVSCGDNTVMGRIARLTSGLANKKTPLRMELERFVLIVSMVAFTEGIILFIIAIAIGNSWINSILLFISILTANVPEGILSQITLELSLVAKRMARKNCLMRNLESVESLGSCSTICSDKTGTLTQNRMTVTHMWFNLSIVQADTPDYTTRSNYRDFPEWRSLYNISAICSRAEFKAGQEDKPLKDRLCTGDASEIALLKAAEFDLGNIVAYRNRCPKVAEIPFNSTNKFHLSIHRLDPNDPKRYEGYEYILCMKGAPERIFERSNRMLIKGQDEKITAQLAEKFNIAYEELGGLGERVLGFSDMYLHGSEFPAEFQFNTEDPNFPMSNLRFVGLISMIDPPRPQVPDAVQKCRSAGIRVIMVTGDHPITAKAIARSVGIISAHSKTKEDIEEERKQLVKSQSVLTFGAESMVARGSTINLLGNKSNSESHLKLESLNGNGPSNGNGNGNGSGEADVHIPVPTAAVIHGTELRDMTPSQIDEVLRNFSELVFARTSPQQKLLIVEGCQRAGAIVGVTGDGVNDSPALKKADIGIAMGITGSDVSKEAAGMVLLDDNFASIVVGCEEGRALFDNLKKAIAYVLTHNFAELMAFLGWFILSIPLTLGAITVLLIDLGTDMIPGIAFAYEDPEDDIMHRPPRNPKKDRMVNWKTINYSYPLTGMVEGLGAYIPCFVIFGDNGFWYQDLLFGRVNYESNTVNDLNDSYGQQWTYEQRLLLQHTVWSYYFAGIMIIQWGNLLVKKTVHSSIFQQGLNTDAITFSLFFETLLALLLIYLPFINYLLYTHPGHFRWYLSPLPITAYFIVWEEIRKAIMRRWPRGHVVKLTDF